LVRQPALATGIVGEEPRALGSKQLLGSARNRREIAVRHNISKVPRMVKHLHESMVGLCSCAMCVGSVEIVKECFGIFPELLALAILIPTPV